jgi:hypothetical protein
VIPEDQKWWIGGAVGLVVVLMYNSLREVLQKNVKAHERLAFAAFSLLSLTVAFLEGIIRYYHPNTELGVLFWIHLLACASPFYLSFGLLLLVFPGAHEEKQGLFTKYLNPLRRRGLLFCTLRDYNPLKVHKRIAYFCYASAIGTIATGIPLLIRL